MIALALAGFLCIGVVLVLLGANQAGLAGDLGLDLAAFGMLGAGLSLGFGVGFVGAGLLVDRRPRRPLFVAASLCAALPLLGFDAGVGFSRAFGSMLLLGVGLGGYETLLNALIAERYRERAARPLVLLHAAATAGAVVGAPALAWIAAARHWTAGFRLCGLAFLALALWAGLHRFAPPPQRHPDWAGVVSLAIVPYMIVGAAYLGIETALTLFCVPYATDALQLDAARGVRAISALWLGLLIGRLAFLAWGGRTGARVLVLCGLASGLLLGGGVALRLSGVEWVVGATGVALGPVFPVMIALAAERFPRARGTAAGLVAGAGALGGFAVPWLAGALGDRAGVEMALGSLALCGLAIAGAAASVAPRTGRSG